MYIYTTTFPCHDCTKHIIAAGIKRVVYVEPYPKSLAYDLYSEFLSINRSNNCDGKVSYQSFVGVSPRCYLGLFEMEKEKIKMVPSLNGKVTKLFLDTTNLRINICYEKLKNLIPSLAK